MANGGNILREHWGYFSTGGVSCVSLSPEPVPTAEPNNQYITSTLHKWAHSKSIPLPLVHSPQPYTYTITDGGADKTWQIMPYLHGFYL